MGVISSSGRSQVRGRTAFMSICLVVYVILPWFLVLNVSSPVVVWGYADIEEDEDGAVRGVEALWFDQDDEPLEEDESFESQQSQHHHHHHVVEHHHERERELQAQCDGEEVEFTQVVYTDLVGVRGLLRPRALFYYQIRLVELYNERVGTDATCIFLTQAQATAQSYFGTDSNNRNQRNLQRGGRLGRLAATVRARTLINGRCRACRRRYILSDLILNGRTRRSSGRRDLVFVNNETDTTTTTTTTTTSSLESLDSAQQQEEQEYEDGRFLQELNADGFDDILLEDLQNSQIDDFECIEDVIFHNENPACNAQDEVILEEAAQRVKARNNNNNNDNNDNDNGGGPPSSSTTPRKRIRNNDGRPT
eukprot:CAMPEP_0198290332 /NCGR_PEP_ID=MMETSP1449-20131203/8255_1 /TAXON_ID=420275 /ORGANISM="Attheya septentrionalis, Strain CCMP2084" /LENGTH=364 /DNA_ID=CAMNT_0043988833 /DNA_START=44 /DNA_END=1141 /DNA_ORIENTATION=-